MKKSVIILTIIFEFTSVWAQDISPQFSELRGIEDNAGNTNLFYRIYSSRDVPNLYDSYSNDIYNLNLKYLSDSIYLSDGYYCSIYMGGGTRIYDYEIWNRDISKYIYCGERVNCFEPFYFVSRYDTTEVLGDMFLYLNRIDISKQNDSIVIVGPMMLKSIDGGITWDTLSLDFNFLSLSPFNDNIIFAEGPYQINQLAIYKSTDGGNTFNLVDTNEYWKTEFFYDIDEKHIYRYSSAGYPNISLKVSFNEGNAFTWSSIYSSNQHFYVSLDPSQSGIIYLADGNKIFRSTDYGNSFFIYKEFEHRIIGIYKKPNSRLLYAATKYNIYEITDDLNTMIKSLPIPEEALAYYPLKVGNIWVYDYTWFETPVTDKQDIFFRVVTQEVTKPNGKNYFEIKEKYFLLGLENTVYERVDTVKGKIYRYEEFCPDSEQFIDDLIMEVSDSTYASRFGFCVEHAPTVFSSEQQFSKWGIINKERVYSYVELLTANYSLVGGVGLNSFTLADDNGERVYNLRGMINDGVVYGDTSIVVGIFDENVLTPIEFTLFQNTPNPFNPSTKISWQSPVSGWQTLKVYDVLGNEVGTLVDEYKPAGSYEIEFNGNKFASGIYYYQLRTGDFVQTKKMILLR